MYVLGLIAVMVGTLTMTNLGYAIDNFCHRPPARDGDEVAFVEEEFSTMFFKIYPDKNIEEDSAMGTATLIDSRGLFITAAHNLESQPAWGESKNWSATLENGKTRVGNYLPDLYLHNPKTGTIVTVKETGQHRTTIKEPDISLLRKKEGEPDLPNAYRPENVVNLFIGLRGNIDPTRSKVVVFGFPAEMKERSTQAMQHRVAHELSSYEKRTGDIVFADFTVPNGLSGALAIEAHGFGIAIVKGDNPGQERDQARTFFTLTNGREARKAIAKAAEKLGLSELGMTIEKELRSVGLSKNSRRVLFEDKKTLKQLDLFLLLITMSSDPEKYAPKIEEDREDWNRLVECHSLRLADERISQIIK